MNEAAPALYRAILGPAFDALPPRVRELHAPTFERRWSGCSQVRRGKGRIANLVAALIGFPPAGDDVAVTVTLAPENGAERWTRDFGSRKFSSLQSRGTGNDQSLLVERFGAISVAIALVVEAEKLRLVPQRWSLFGVPLPRALLPKGSSYETQRCGKFCFDVEISAPLVGLIVAYTGQLDADA